MCGIAGYIAPVGSLASRDVLARQLKAIAHRGPDHTGTFIENNVALGNQRLKIIDLAGGNQPIENEDGSVVVVYNGEIYNYRELRAHCVERGHRFRTQSDTEVLVHLYEEYGLGMLPLLNGMFAFALHDRRQRKTLVARDRFGVKPLFYTETADGFFFGSELRSLFAVPSVPRKPSVAGLKLFLSQMYVPQPWTAYENVWRLPSAGYLEIGPDGQKSGQYYDFDFGKKIAVSAADALERTASLVQQAVERQLVADVPVGVFLSGGLDSSAVCAFAAKRIPDLRSFTLAFEDGLYDENPVSSAWAAHFGARHDRVLLAEEDFVGQLEDRLSHAVEPVGPWINTGKMYLAKYAAEAGVRVVLNGAGGDELFCGYPTLQAARFADAYRRLAPESLRRAISAWAERSVSAGRGRLPLRYVFKRFLSAVRDTPEHSFLLFKSVLDESELGAILTPEAAAAGSAFGVFEAYEQYRAKTRGWPLLDRLQYLDLKNFLEGSILLLGDHATMRHSLEERVPFLDNDLVDFAVSLPTSRKFAWTRLKPLLRRALLERFEKGDGTVTRLLRSVKKKGFELPANEWARRGPLLRYLRHRLAPERVGKLGFFEPAAVTATLDAHVQGRTNSERRLQAILGVVDFLERGATA